MRCALRDVRGAISPVVSKGEPRRAFRFSAQRAPGPSSTRPWWHRLRGECLGCHISSRRHPEAWRPRPQHADLEAHVNGSPSISSLPALGDCLSGTVPSVGGNRAMLPRTSSPRSKDVGPLSRATNESLHVSAALAFNGRSSSRSLVVQQRGPRWHAGTRSTSHAFHLALRASSTSLP